MADLVKFTDTSASPETFTYTTNDIVNKGVVGQTDVPGLTAEQMQRKAEELVRKVVMPLVNRNADDTCTVSTYDTDADGRVDGADEADTLTTARAIGLTDADGTNTGTGVSFDGSADVTLKLPAAIKANITGAVTGNVTGDVSGNAGTATQLATARTLAVQDYGGTHSGAGVSFDGTANATMKLPSTIAANFIGDVNGNAASADKWKTARNFTVKDADSTNSGVAASADGSAAVTLNLPSTIKAAITGNVTGDVSGNAGTATKLATSRTLNIQDADASNTGTGASFDGSGNATVKLPATIKATLNGNAATATKLATAQSITVGSKTNSFDGSAGISFALSDVGASAVGHSHAESDVTNLTTDLAAKLPLAGGTMTGDLTLYGAPTLNLHAATKKYVDDSISSAGGGDMLKTTYDSNADGTVNAADTAAACTGNSATTDKWKTARTFTVKDSDSTNSGTATTVDGSENETLLLPSTIKASITGNCSGYSGSCVGNAATATKLSSARTLNIQDSDATNTGTGATFDGSGNATIKLPATIKASITGNVTGDASGNAGTATKLAATKNITVGSKTNAFDGSADITFSLADAGAVASPTAVSGTGTISVTVADNTEYSYTAVTSLTMTGAAVGCHGFITFGSTAPTISVSGFTASGGDDITGAAASEVWEFSVYAHNSGSYIVWKNWSA